MKPATLLSTLFLALVAIGHVVRFVLRLQVTVAGVEVPMWCSIPAAILFAGLAFALWREHRAPAA